MAGPSPERPNMADQEVAKVSLRRRSNLEHVVDDSVNCLEGTSDILNNVKQQQNQKTLTPDQQDHLYLEFNLRGVGGKGRAMMYRQQKMQDNEEDNWHPEDDTSTFFSKVG